MLMWMLSIAYGQDTETIAAQATPTCPTRAVASTGTWPEGTAPNPDAIAALDAWAFPTLSPEDEAERRGMRTEGLLIVQGGQIIYERYARGFTAEMPHLTWSVSKTFTNALVGLAVRDGRMDLDDSICEYFSAPNLDNCRITIADLLTFGSGIQWKESYESAPTTSSVVAMLYGEGTPDMASFVAGQPRHTDPGTVWQYSSGDTTLLAGVVQAAMEPALGRDFPWTELFDPLGMTSIVWERDQKGTLVGSSYLYGTPRDLARFGMLWLDDGCWNGERLLPEGWVARSTQVSNVITQSTRDRAKNSVQGMQVWLNQPIPEQNLNAPPWKGVPANAFAAQGHWKQTITVIPTHDMVIVRVGDDRDKSWRYGELYRKAIAAADPIAPAPAPRDGTPRAEPTNEIVPPMKFKAGLLPIGAAYGAKLGCSCAFVMKQSPEYCEAWVKASPDIVKLKIDEEAGTVTGRVLGMLSAQTARYVNERDGCLLE